MADSYSVKNIYHSSKVGVSQFPVIACKMVAGWGEFVMLGTDRGITVPASVKAPK